MSIASVSHASPATNYTFPVRAPKFDFQQPVPILWFRGNTFLTFAFNGINLTFPHGERFFVRCLNGYLPQLKDPLLRQQVRAFNGQEGLHANAHERAIELLRAQGFDLEPFFRLWNRVVGQLNKQPPGALSLAITAALEHYTSTLASLQFEADLTDGAAEPMRTLVIWHLAEEVEHRAVAFDVLREVSPGYPLRAFGFVLGSMVFLGWAGLATRLFVKQSKTPWSRFREDAKQASALIGGGKRLATLLLEYLKPDFHPAHMGGLDKALAVLRAEGLDQTIVQRS